MSAFDVLTVSAVLELIPLNDPAPKVVSASDWASVISAMTSQISVSTVVGVLATLVTAGIGLVFLWWGVRKAVGSLMGSFRSGTDSHTPQSRFPGVRRFHYLRSHPQG